MKGTLHSQWVPATGMMLVGIVVSFIPLNWLLDRDPECGPHREQNVLRDTETVLDQDS